MGILARVVRNFLALTTSLVLERAISFVLFLFIARQLDADVLGEYALAFSFLAIFETLSVFGQNLLIVREVARDRYNAGQYLIQSSILVLMSSAIWAVTMPQIARGLSYPAQTVYYVGLMALVLVPDSLAVVPESVIQGWERMEFITAFRFLTHLVGTTLSVFLLLKGQGLAAVLYVLVGQRAILAALYSWLVWHRIHPSLRFDRVFFCSLVSLSLPFLGMNALSAVYKNVDVWILRGMTNAAEVGYYSAADRPIQMVGLLMPILMVAIYPSLAETYRIAPDRFERMLRAGLYGLAVTVPFIAMLFTVAAPSFVAFAYGEGYAATTLPLQILAWSLVPTSIAALLFRALLASNNERVSLRVAFVNMAVNVSLNLTLIPRWGAVGASAVALLTSLVGLAQNYWFVERHLVRLKAGRLFVRPALGMMLAGGLFLLLPGSWPLYVRGSVATLSYLAFLVASGALSRREVALLQAALRDLRHGAMPLPDRS